MQHASRRRFLRHLGTGLAAVSLPLAGWPASFTAGDKKLNIALLGLGRYAGYLAEGLQETRYCRLAGVVTGTPAKARDWQKKYQLPAANIYDYENFDTVAGNPGIDLIYVVTPNALHKEFVLRAARAGKHVIVEKPMAVSVADCLEMIDACKKAEVALAMGYRLHYEPYNMEMKRLGQEKVFGQVKLVEASLGYKAIDNPGEWRLHKALSGGGPLMNLGIYCVQAARYITGEEPVSLTAQFGPVTYPAIFKEVEESITWQMRFPSGALCTSSTTYNCGIDRLYASAGNGFFELSPAISYGPFRGRTSRGELNFPVINQQAAQMDGIARCILDGRPLPGHISGEEGLKDMRVIEAIYAAAASGKETRVG